MVSLINVTFIKDTNMSTLIHLVSSKIQAGFPSPADDYIESQIDLNTVMIKRPAATNVTTMPDNSLASYGIHKNDYLVVDSSLSPKQNSLVISLADGDTVIGWLHFRNGQITIGNDQRVYQSAELTIIGVVTWIIRRFT